MAKTEKNMRNIAIIEDDGVAQKMLCDYLKRYGSEKNEQFDYFPFGSAEQFLTDYRPDYDVVFMDIVAGDEWHGSLA